MLALALMLTLSQSQTTFTDPMYAACPDAPPSVPMDGGVWLPPERASRVACLLETCDVDRTAKTKLLDGPSKPVWWVGWASALTLGIMVGFGSYHLVEWLRTLGP